MPWSRTVALCCALLALTGCGSAGTAGQAGGRAEAGPMVLTLASIRDAAEVEDFVAQVDRLSGGAVRIEARRRWPANEPESEADLVREVRAGTHALGVVGARVWHGLGAGLAISAGEVAARSMAALGAAGVPYAFEGAPVDGFDGVELQIAAVRGTGTTAGRSAR
ncbi:hypothetical protein [Nonomuraea rubra]|uniref:ABC transporter substrate-binding protein n=1 Tax=Nonomuraea rubra TaxID=46180 RepID=A0A7X0NVF0_9ACTN|nr:hypothetical protein [Nonomuraea rubra]MBB6550116.1 hypothetical protein [Nonomuraea rubra]